MSRENYELIGADRPEFEWLNMVRDHGSMNMFQAGQSLQDAFGLNQREAKKVLLEWMQLVQKKAHTEQHS